MDCEIIIIGAGIVGLALARELSTAGHDTVLIEKAPAPMTDTSSRNSEVIHAGIYYRPGSLKAETCVAGRIRLYDYLSEHHIPHRQVGKLILACDDSEVSHLHELEQRARANGVDDLRWFSAADIRAAAPELTGRAALLSPSTGIVDSHALGRSLLAMAENAGCTLALNTSVEALEMQPDSVVVRHRDQSQGQESMLRARHVVCAAGHAGTMLYHRTFSADTARKPYTARFAKGNYASVSGKPPCDMLVYPAPQTHGLGVHVTTDLGGRSRLGPDVQWVDSPDEHAPDPDFGERAQDATARYWPEVRNRHVESQYAGIRPKIELNDRIREDFLIEEDTCTGNARVWHLLAIDSPGLTAALDLAGRVRQHIEYAKR